MKLRKFMVGALVLMLASATQAEDPSGPSRTPQPGSEMQTLIKALSGR